MRPVVRGVRDASEYSNGSPAAFKLAPIATVPAATMDPKISPAEQAARDELSAYTLTHGDPDFMHQHVVDAFAAQHATQQSKPIGVAFALIGLYSWSAAIRSGAAGPGGAQASRATCDGSGPLDPPRDAGELTVIDVMRSPPGVERDRAIEDWCGSVWAAWHGSHARVVALLGETA